ncbi:MAG: non-canonical purine NTP pyrophosphatase [Bacilli bacterium]|nr:non-canonical purine NTP pyrophosphatase [Bacilli bacterium]
MKVIFGTTNERKVEDLRNQSMSLGIDLEIIGMNDIGWDLGEIEETGTTIEENSLIKANAIRNFCLENNIEYPIITDDAGLFCESLNGKPGIFTGRYADEEIKENPELPKYQCVIKLLNDMKGIVNRKATYRCAVTCMFPDGSYFQEIGESAGTIAEDIIGELKKPYFYSIFILDGYNKAFSDLSVPELKETYRFRANKKVLTRLNTKKKD